MEKFLITVDCVCSSCGYHNRDRQFTTEKVTIVACGACGVIIKQMPEVAESDVPMIKKILEETIRGKTDVVLR